MGCVNIVCQMLHAILIGKLSVRGIVLQGAITGGGNLCGNLSAGVVKDSSPHFEKGGKYAIIGPSGCGKSTLLKLLLGCLPEYAGSISLDGREIRDYRPEQIWH